MEALRSKLVKRLESMMATVDQSTGSISGQLRPSSAARIADAVLVVTRTHDEDYARTLELADAFRRLPVQIRVNEAKAPFADGYLDDESVAMLCAAAERDFAARQPDTGWGGDRAPEPGTVVDAHIHCEHAPASRAAHELAVADQIVQLLGPVGSYDGGRRVKRVLRWAWDYLTDGDEPPF